MLCLSRKACHKDCVAPTAPVLVILVLVVLHVTCVRVRRVTRTPFFLHQRVAAAQACTVTLHLLQAQHPGYTPGES
jgi:hypothetical protein